MKNKVGIVFAGGGGKGSYQIGVWRALKEFGIDQNISVVSGASVGALNAALFAQGNYENALDVWLNITREDILNIDIKNIIKFLPSKFNPDKIAYFFNSHGMFSRKGLLNILNNHINLNSISNLDLFANCSDVTIYPSSMRESLAITNGIAGKRFGSEKYFNLKELSTEFVKTTLLASSALPLIFAPEEIDGRIYYDGGLSDNVPIKPVYDKGCNLIIVIHLKRDNIIDHNKFPNAQILEVIPQDDQGGLMRGTLDFSTEGVIRRMECGYRDAIRILEPIYKMGLTQFNIKKNLEILHEDELIFKTKRKQILKERENLKLEIDQLVNKGEQ